MQKRAQTGTSAAANAGKCCKPGEFTPPQPGLRLCPEGRDGDLSGRRRVGRERRAGNRKRKRHSAVLHLRFLQRGRECGSAATRKGLGAGRMGGGGRRAGREGNADGWLLFPVGTLTALTKTSPQVKPRQLRRFPRNLLEPPALSSPHTTPTPTPAQKLTNVGLFLSFACFFFPGGMALPTKQRLSAW